MSELDEKTFNRYSIHTLCITLKKRRHRLFDDYKKENEGKTKQHHCIEFVDIYIFRCN